MERPVTTLFMLMSVDGKISPGASDYLDFAPVLVGGKTTSTLIDRKSILAVEQLPELGVLKLESVQPLEGSYIRLRYKVIA